MVNSYCKLLLLLSLSSITSCATLDQQSTSYSHEVIKCSVFQVMSDKNTLGTGFFLDYDGKIFAITTSHSLLAANNSKINVRPACSQDVFPVKSYYKLGGLDAAVLIPEKIEKVKGIIVNHSEILFATKIFGVSFPILQNAEPRFKGLPIPVTGLLVKISEPDILFTMDVVQIGSSGTPIVNSSGNLVGMMTNRVLIEGNYTGVSYGISAKSLLSAISNNFSAK